jgi:RNA polymerase sigma factor (sigma-70 family)
MTVPVLVQRWAHGDEVARDQLMPVLYEYLRDLAESTRNADEVTAMAHEVYNRLVGVRLPCRDRAHFFAAVARAIRCVLLDHFEGPSQQIALARAFRKLSSADPRKAELLEMLHFAGMTLEECGVSLGISTTTVHREVTGAKAWLRKEMGRAPVSA